MPNTYVELDKVTASGTSTTTVNFTNIPSGYTDLVIVVNCGISNADYLNLRAGNGSVNTGSIYSQTVLEGNGSSATSSRGGSRTAFWPSWTTTIMPTSLTANYIINIMNYSNTTTNKTFMSRGSVTSAGLDASACTFNSTVAINTISLFPNSQDGRYFLAGSTFSLYGIANADQGAAKATGGIITEDANYWYHTFGASGAFVPKQNLTCDYLVIAGGGGGGSFAGGGGGAGGYKTADGFSVTANTNYTVTIGAGGAGGAYTSGTNGVNSVFGSITSTGGGGGGGTNFNTNGGAGGSGGGASGSYNFGTGTGGAASPSGQGNAGGSTSGGLSNLAYAAAGGGGAGAVGGSANSTLVAGAGGAGLASSINGTSVTRAGGGGGGSDPKSGGAGGAGGGGEGGLTTASAGTVNTGSGGGGIWNPNFTAGAGGSGIVIVRYAK